MQQYIGIAVTDRSFIMRYLYTADPKLSPFRQPVKIYA
jgi:hypothetical protein